MKNKVRYLFSNKPNVITKTLNIRTVNAISAIVIGTSASHLINSAPNMKTISLYVDCTAASGDNRGIYNRLYFTVTNTGGGESLRSYTEIGKDVTVATAHGAHLSLGMGESTDIGKITGLGAAVRSTLGIPNGTLLGGTYTALMAEIYSFGASSDASGVTRLSVLRAVNDGNTAGKDIVDDKAVLISLAGFTSASGSLIYTHTITTPGAGTGSLKIHIEGVGDKFLYYWDTEGAT